MIKINDKWGIVIDDLSYCPIRFDKPVVSKGKTYYSKLGYYETLQGAISKVAEEMARDELKASDMSLSEAVRVIRECNEKIENLVQGEQC